MSNQIVNIELGNLDNGISIEHVINTILTSRMKSLNLGQSLSYLDLGFSISDNYPMGEDLQLSTLVVLARKLKLRIVIKDIRLEEME